MSKSPTLAGHLEENPSWELGMSLSWGRFIRKKWCLGLDFGPKFAHPSQQFTVEWNQGLQPAGERSKLHTTTARWKGHGGGKKWSAVSGIVQERKRHANLKAAENDHNSFFARGAFFAQTFWDLVSSRALSLSTWPKFGSVMASDSDHKKSSGLLISLHVQRGTLRCDLPSADASACVASILWNHGGCRSQTAVWA